MPGCAAVGCNNRSEKGYIMKCFPRDPKLRKIWQERVARADWEPSNNSFLCHVHFEPQEWSITQSGRIRLKKNAIPSIFTITSTRKSPKKRTQTINIKTQNISQNQFGIQFLANDTRYLSAGNLGGKELHGINENSLQLLKNKTIRFFPQSVPAQVHSGFQGNNVILILHDNTMNIGSSAKPVEHDVELNVDRKNMNSESTNENASTVVEEEVTPEIMDHSTFNDSYDEIEEKLKQICDGECTEDENEKISSGRKFEIKSHKESQEKLDVNCDFNNSEVALPANTNHNLSTKNEIGRIVTDKRENIEIIFGTESGDEKTLVCQSDLYKSNDTVDDSTLEDDQRICANKEKKVLNEDIEENFTKDEVHVIPNMRAAMKRKRRTRDEIMKSIKKSIKSTSDQDLYSSSNSDLSDSIDQETEDKHKFSKSPREMRGNKNNDAPIETAKFIIKVTGDPDDVTEIIEDLSSNTMGAQVSQKLMNPCNDQQTESLVTSVITVVSPKNVVEINDNDSNISLVKDGYVVEKNRVFAIDHSPENDRELVGLNSGQSPGHSPYFGHAAPSSDDDDITMIANASSQTQNYSHSPLLPSDYEDLLERVNIQEDVIAKLTDQLIAYKELENSLQSKSMAREVQTREVDTLTNKLNTRSSNTQSAVVNKKNLESKQRLIEDLSNRVNYFEEMNKKLMKTVTLESQQKRKLEGQIKQKDNRIKELNWKLEKASKYLDRAEKNTNTYRRKMLNMQTIMRRRKLLDENMSKFSEMLIDSTKHEYTEKALNVATEVRQICGRAGYDKLLSYGFPLPPLPALRKGYLNDDFTDCNESDVDKVRNISTKINVKTEKTKGLKNEPKEDANNSKLSESTTKPTDFDGAETVTGTVQDIFDENNDGDDFSTNELREHFILQLNAVM